MQQNLHIITLGVKSLKKSLAFYEGGLGWEKSKASVEGEIAFFKLGGIVFSLYPQEKLLEDIGTASPSSPSSTKSNNPEAKSKNTTNTITLAYNTPSEKAVDEVMKKVTHLGATIVKPPQKVFWGGYSGYFKDLDGHLFEVAYNPFVEFDEKGNLILKEN